MRLTEARECFLFVCVSVLFCLDEGALVVPGHSKESMSGGQTNIKRVPQNGSEEAATTKNQ